jgi:hypothetical protein
VLIRSASGAEVLLSRFLLRKSRCEWLRSETLAVRKVRVASRSPIIVRYWKCQP